MKTIVFSLKSTTYTYLTKQHALKGQKLLAQGVALGIKAFSKAPYKGKSFKTLGNNKAFALTGRQVCEHNNPGRCPGLRASALSGRAAHRKLYLRSMTVGSGRAASVSFLPLPSVGDRWFWACGTNMRYFNNQKVLLHNDEAGLFGYNIFIATHPNGCGTMSRESFADSWQCKSMEHATPPEDSVRTDACICWAQSRNASGRHEPATG